MGYGVATKKRVATYCSSGALAQFAWGKKRGCDKTAQSRDEYFLLDRIGMYEVLRRGNLPSFSIDTARKERGKEDIASPRGGGETALISFGGDQGVVAGSIEDSVRVEDGIDRKQAGRQGRNTM